MHPEVERMLGESPIFLHTLEQVSLVAPLEKPVLIVGERGTGKELIAARLHYLSNRWEGQFLKMNCAAISESLMESELFGHEAGAFTGATKAHAGRFERAHGGSLFLDELAATSIPVQEKLLRVIEYGEFDRLGGTKTLTCDVRLIAATNQDLPTLAAEKKFRSDLLDRLAFDVLTLPPLRDREDDIPLLANYFAINMAKELGRDYFPGFNARAMNILATYSWPGNIRELKNVVERSVYRTEPEDEVAKVVIDPFESPHRPVKTQSVQTQTPFPTWPIDLKEVTRTSEIDRINAAMSEAKHNQRRAAELLGLTYHQLRGYLKKYLLIGNQKEEEGPAT